MKKFVTMLLFGLSLPLVAVAQDDDVYFTPASKKAKSAEAEQQYDARQRQGYVRRGTLVRDVDEYNRRNVRRYDDSVSGYDEAQSNYYYEDSYEADDYVYSSRLARFHSPGITITVGSPYWYDYYADYYYWDNFYNPWWSSRWAYNWYYPWAYRSGWRYGWDYGYYGWSWGYYDGWYSPWYYERYYWPRHYGHYVYGSAYPSGGVRHNTQTAGRRSYGGYVSYGGSNNRSTVGTGRGQSVAGGSRGSVNYGGTTRGTIGRGTINSGSSSRSSGVYSSPTRSSREPVYSGGSSSSSRSSSSGSYSVPSRSSNVGSSGSFGGGTSRSGGSSGGSFGGGSRGSRSGR